VVRTRTDPIGNQNAGVLVTPSVVDARKLPNATTDVMMRLDRSDPDALERVRNTAAHIDPGMFLQTLAVTSTDRHFTAIRRGLFIGAVGTLVLIGASMIVAILEQLRERRRLLSVLVAFGTRRTTLGWSVLWQTAIPVVLGLALSVVGGLGLGEVMLKLVDGKVQDWLAFLPIVGAGAAVIALVTLASMPALWRMMRPDGLRTE
jgi:predicted lysophospholipase L1 biosynthesis ABC-type transport system permease subunit